MPQDLRMVVLAVSPRAALHIRAACERTIEDTLAIESELAEHEQQAIPILQAVINEIEENIGKLPSVEQYAEYVKADPATIGGTVAALSAAEQVADKMAKASRKAAEGDD
jgi:hypothetical protein